MPERSNVVGKRFQNLHEIYLGNKEERARTRALEKRLGKPISTFYSKIAEDLISHRLHEKVFEILSSNKSNEMKSILIKELILSNIYVRSMFHVSELNKEQQDQVYKGILGIIGRILRVQNRIDINLVTGQKISTKEELANARKFREDVTKTTLENELSKKKLDQLRQTAEELERQRRKQEQKNQDQTSELRLGEKEETKPIVSKQTKEYLIEKMESELSKFIQNRFITRQAARKYYIEFEKLIDEQGVNTAIDFLDKELESFRKLNNQLIENEKRKEELNRNLLDLNKKLRLAASMKDYKGAEEVYRQTIDVCNQLIELDSKNEFAYGNRAIAKSNLKDISGAIADFEKVLELNPNNKIARVKLKDLIAL